jgi:hypothetical protein
LSTPQNSTVCYYGIITALSTAFLALGLGTQLPIVGHPESIRLPARVFLASAMAVIYVAGFVFTIGGAHEQSEAISTTAFAVTPLVYGSVIALCLAYFTVALAEFVITFQRFEILIVHLGSEIVIDFARWEMIMMLLLVEVVLVFCMWVFCIKGMPAIIRRLKKLDKRRRIRTVFEPMLLFYQVTWSHWLRVY